MSCEGKPASASAAGWKCHTEGRVEKSSEDDAEGRYLEEWRQVLLQDFSSTDPLGGDTLCRNLFFMTRLRHRKSGEAAQPAWNSVSKLRWRVGPARCSGNYRSSRRTCSVEECMRGPRSEVELGPKEIQVDSEITMRGSRQRRTRKVGRKWKAVLQ